MSNPTEKDIQCVISQTNCTTADATQALIKHKNDVVDAIIELTLPDPEVYFNSAVDFDFDGDEPPALEDMSQVLHSPEYYLRRLDEIDEERGLTYDYSKSDKQFRNDICTRHLRMPTLPSPMEEIIKNQLAEYCQQSSDKEITIDEWNRHLHLPLQQEITRIKDLVGNDEVRARDYPMALQADGKLKLQCDLMFGFMHDFNQFRASDQKIPVVPQEVNPAELEKVIFSKKTYQPIIIKNQGDMQLLPAQNDDDDEPDSHDWEHGD